VTSPTQDLAALHDIFPPAVVDAIAARAQSSNGFKILHETLTATNENSEIARSHLAKCLRFAQDHNGLDTDRLKRLCEPADYATWRAVHNELLVAYFVAKHFALQVSFIVNPTQKGQGDFQIAHSTGRIIVEVKTPKGDDPDLRGPTEKAHYGWDNDLIRTAFLQGAKQVRKGNRNLIVICTQLCAWIHDWMPLEKLLYGQEVITANFDPKRGQITRPRTEFRPDGKLLGHRPKRHTRVSAVASFRTDAYSEGPFDPEVMQVQFAVLHNYFAACHIPPRVFSAAEQFIPDKRRRRITHVNEKRATLLFYMGENSIQDARTRLKVGIHGLFRKMTRSYYKLKMRRVMKTMACEQRDELDR